MKHISIAVITGFLLLLVYHFNKAIVLGPGVKAPIPPYQTPIKDGKAFKFRSGTVTPLAEFEITAKIILKKNYSSGSESEFSPVDLALGWERMSDESVLEQIDFSQSGRWYRYRYSSPPIPQDEISSQSANMHLVPANDFVEKQIDRVREGQIIKIKGKLVEIRAQNKWKWRSSLRRDDSGGGACELIYVESLRIIEGD